VCSTWQHRMEPVYQKVSILYTWGK